MKRDSQLQRFGFPDGGTHCGNPHRAAHLKLVRAIREGTRPAPRQMGAGRDGFAGVELSIPELDYYVIVHSFPDLRSPDHEIKRKAWLKFLRDPASEPYRVHRQKRGPRCRSLTAR